MPLPKLIATDLDGTLLDRQGRLSERNQKALQTAREHGILTLAVTARPPRAVHRVPGLTAVLDGALCSTGSIRFDPVTQTAELRHAIPLALARELHRQLRIALPDADFAVETGQALRIQGEYFRGLRLTDPWIPVTADEDLIDTSDPVVGLLVHDTASTGPAMQEATAHIALPGVHLWGWGRYPEIECTAAGAEKGATLAAWCAERGIGAEDVIAFGDMPNDVSMLAWAGRSYAMEGAHADAAAAATGHAEPAAEDGVAKTIEALLQR
ncbi:HAD family hydrolase [Glycomyces luteolus]|uniref:HAD family hydrolase n=1 Tax=Glycomyces luteolus TaxID=2670330 RepID=A0A9X3P9F0_9ACTN|nr:HAD family hydrolase [Glycomyces luteolus]MDA1360031.1 HAD family hydrolase [Glycomyces luteolus]